MKHDSYRWSPHISTRRFIVRLCTCLCYMLSSTTSPTPLWLLPEAEMRSTRKTATSCLAMYRPTVTHTHHNDTVLSSMMESHLYGVEVPLASAPLQDSTRKLLFLGRNKHVTGHWPVENLGPCATFVLIARWYYIVSGNWVILWVMSGNCAVHFCEVCCLMMLRL